MTVTSSSNYHMSRMVEWTWLRCDRSSRLGLLQALWCPFQIEYLYYERETDWVDAVQRHPKISLIASVITTSSVQAGHFDQRHDCGFCSYVLAEEPQLRYRNARSRCAEAWRGKDVAGSPSSPSRRCRMAPVDLPVQACLRRSDATAILLPSSAIWKTHGPSVNRSDRKVRLARTSSG
jgi:hypothetical protein